MIDKNEALLSALERLPLAVVVVDHSSTLRPMNKRGQAFFDRESLHPDLLQSHPSHPLSQLVRGILDSPPDELAQQVILRFPSGARYGIEPSQRSEKGRERWTMLLVSTMETESIKPDETLLHDWPFTARERSIAVLLMQGMTNGEIAAKMEISLETVKSHIANVLQKTESRSRGGFLAKLLRRR